MKLKEIVDSTSFDSEIDNKCLKVLFEDIANNLEEFKKFFLSKHILENLELYGKDELYDLMEHKLENARFKGKGGWWYDDCDAGHLEDLLNEHLKKDNLMNNIDICNFSMFIYFKLK